MNRDFFAELKGIISGVDNAKPRIPFYVIRKRSLPIGTDRVVMMRLRLEEARRLTQTVFKTKISHNGVTYYDIVPSNGTLDELDVLYNPKEAFCK